MINKLLKFALRASSAASVVLPLLALAQGPQTPPPVTNFNSLNEIARQVCVAANWFFTFLIILAVIFVIYAAFKYLTAGGDPENVKKASHILIYAAVAVVVAIVAKGFPLIIGSLFSSGGQPGFTGCGGFGQ